MLTRAKTGLENMRSFDQGRTQGGGGGGRRASLGGCVWIL